MATLPRIATRQFFGMLFVILNIIPEIINASSFFSLNSSYFSGVINDEYLNFKRISLPLTNDRGFTRNWILFDYSIFRFYKFFFSISSRY
jgi:hypothetical protein